MTKLNIENADSLSHSKYLSVEEIERLVDIYLTRKKIEEVEKIAKLGGKYLVITTFTHNFY